MGLGHGIVLHHGGEIHALAGEEGADIAEVGRHGVVGGQGDEEGAVGAEVGLGGHADGGVGDAVGQFGQGVAGAGADDQSLQRAGGAQGLGLGDGADDGTAADGFDAVHEVGGFSEAGVGGGGDLAHDGEDVVALLFQLGQHLHRS